MNTPWLSKASLNFFPSALRARAKITGRSAKSSGCANSFEMEIEDERRILFRPLAPNDREGLHVAFNRLSLESRLSRFFIPLADFSEDMLRCFTEVDPRQHVAWCAIDHSLSNQPLVGTVRFVRYWLNPQIAEMSIEVIDAYQNKGIGMTLFCVLYNLARLQGIHTLIAEVYPANRRLLDFLGRWGITGRLQDGVIEVEFPVHRDEVLFSQFWPSHEFKLLAEKVHKKLVVHQG